MVRSFALADRFLKDGHEVAFTSCTSKKNFIEKNGYKVIKTYVPFNFNDEEDQSINYLESHKKEMVGWFRAEIEAAKDFVPDVVISSPSFLGAHIYHATGIPVVALMNGQYPPTSKGLMGISLSSDTPKNILLRSVLRPIFLRNFSKNYIKYVMAAYEELGLRSDFQTTEELYADMPILIAGDDEFEPQRKILEKDRFVGPIFWDGFEKLNGDMSEESLVKFKGDKKLIYLTFGGSVFNKDVYTRILEGLQKIDAQKIVALGPNFKREDFPEDREDLMIVNFAPGLRVSKIANLIINTGSQGAIMQALSCATPVVAFPVGIDQAYFANRLEEMGVGKNINKSNILNFSKRESYQFVDDSIPNKMIEAAMEILNDNKYQEKAFEYSLCLFERHPRPVEEVVSYIYDNFMP